MRFHLRRNVFRTRQRRRHHLGVGRQQSIPHHEGQRSGSGNGDQSTKLRFLLVDFTRLSHDEPDEPGEVASESYGMIHVLVVARR